MGTIENKSASYFENTETKTTMRIDNDRSKDKAVIAAEKQNLVLVHKHNKENEDADMIESILTHHFLLRALEKQARQEIIKEVSLYKIENPNTVIFKRGDEPGHFYILSKGSIELLSDNLTSRVIKPGTCFGDKSLIYGTTHTYSAVAKSECLVWTLEKRNFRKILNHITHITFEDNVKSTYDCAIISMLTHEHKTKLLNNLFRETHFDNNKIYGKGDYAHAIYLIKDGEINVKKEKEAVFKLGKGDMFGGLEILLQTDRLLDVVPTSKTHLYSISIKNLIEVLGKDYTQILQMSVIKSAFNRSAKFNGLNVKLIEEIFHLFSFTYYEKETLIIKKGTSKSAELIIPIEGELKDELNPTILCKQGNILFIEDIYEQSNKIAERTVKCSVYCILARAKTEEIVQYFGCTFKELTNKNSAIQQLKRVALFKNLSNVKLETLSKKIKTQKLKDGENLITQGEEGSRFYIVKRGLIDIYVNEQYIRTMNENEYLGERALFFKEPRSATAKAHGDSEVFYLEKEDFETVIEGNLKEYLVGRLYLQDNKVELKELQFYGSLGSGSFGKVSLVKSTKNNYFYAIKNISCKQILAGHLFKHLTLERGILLQVDHPFIVKLVKTMKDEKYIYFLMDYIKGKELFDVIRDIGLLNKFQTQFYSASMMLAVQYLHERSFVYRDIKPENVIVCENGFIKVIDFGTAKSIKEKTFTIIGTPHYMAPEIVVGEGYDFKVDFWSIAICMYEFICGAVPFGETAEKPMDVYVAIVNE